MSPAIQSAATISQGPSTMARRIPTMIPKIFRAFLTKGLLSSRTRATDNADLTVPLEYRERHVPDVVDVPVEPQVYQEIVFAQTMPGGGLLINRAVSDDDGAASLDDLSERVRAA